MWHISKILLIAAMATIAVASSDVTPATTEATEIPMDMFVQVMETSSDANDAAIYHYICTAGIQKLDFMMCTYQDSTKWSDHHNIDVRFRCPGSGAGKPVVFIQIDAWVTSDQFECKITGGGIGQLFIELLVSARNTKQLDYVTNVYSTY